MKQNLWSAAPFRTNCTLINETFSPKFFNTKKNTFFPSSFLCASTHTRSWLNSIVFSRLFSYSWEKKVSVQPRKKKKNTQKLEQVKRNGISSKYCRHFHFSLKFTAVWCVWKNLLTFPRNYSEFCSLFNLSKTNFSFFHRVANNSHSNLKIQSCFYCVLVLEYFFRFFFSFVSGFFPFYFLWNENFFFYFLSSAHTATTTQHDNNIPHTPRLLSLWAMLSNRICAMCFFFVCSPYSRIQVTYKSRST